MSPIGGRRKSRSGDHDRSGDAAIGSSSVRRTHTLSPTDIRSAPSTTCGVSGTQRHPLADYHSDESAASCDAPWIECTHFGAEIRQIEPPPARLPAAQAEVGDKPTTESSSRDHDCTDSVLSANDSPSRQTKQEDGDGEKEEDSLWQRKQACSRRISKKTKILRRCHSHDCGSTKNWIECPASLPVSFSATGRLQSLEHGSPVLCSASSGDHPLTVVCKDGDCHRQDDVDAAAAAAAAADNSPSTSLCLAREILHELEEDLVDSPEPPSSDTVPRSECGRQQIGIAAESAVHRPSDDVIVPCESNSPRRLNDCVPLTSHCHSEGRQTSQKVAPESHTSPDTATDAKAERGLLLRDASATVGYNSTPFRPPNSSEPDAPSETIAGTLKNMFAYFIAKLGGYDRKDIQREQHCRQLTVTSPHDDHERPRKKQPRTHAVCPADRKWLATNNGTALSTAAHVAEILSARRKDGDALGERLALPIPLGGTLDRVLSLSLVPSRAVRAGFRGGHSPRPRCNTAGDVDVICRLRRRFGDRDDDERSAPTARRRTRSVTVASITDWICSGSVASPSTSPPSSSSSSLRSSFYERKMISDLEEVERAAAETDVGDAGGSSHCPSDFCDEDDDDDDQPVYGKVPVVTLTDVDGRESLSDLSSSSTAQSAVIL